MRNACRKALFIISAAIPAAFAASARDYPNGLAMDSVHPAQDSVFIRQMRDEMRRIRREEKRPTVALVLSGGGAKGAALTGALKLLEEKDFPIDIVCGTSIGGLVGALTAVGYSASDIKDLFDNQDWGKTLTDRIDKKYYPLFTKKHKDKYILTIPFLYEHGFREELQGIGAKPENVGKNKNGRAFTNSLPAGFSSGLNVNNLLSSLTVGYQDSLDFADLPIPFFCVAADVVSCKEKNWGAGSLTTAMRSTMSIPGLFEPVRTDGMVLVDGGLRNNYPVDIVNAIGVDYVIGVDLSDADLGYAEVNHFFDIVGQFTTMLGSDSFSRNKTAPDIVIKPDLTGYNMLSFEKAAIDTMAVRGYDAALKQEGAIDSLKMVIGNATRKKIGKKAIDISAVDVTIGSVNFEGVSGTDEIYMERLTGIMAGDKVNSTVMEEAMSKLKATGCFENISYSLLGTEEPFNLVFRCTKSPVHQFSLGVRLDTEEWVSLLLNVGLNARKLTGSKFDLSLKFGLSQMLSAQYSLDLPGLPTINAQAEIAYERADLNSALQHTSYNAAFWKHAERIYLSNRQWKQFDFQAGIQNRFLGMPGDWMLSNTGHSILQENIAADFLGVYAEGTFYKLDDRYFPHAGISASFNYALDFTRAGNPDFLPINALGGNIKAAIPFGEKVTLAPSLYFRSVWDRNINQSVLHKNYVGGSMAGRYFDQQVPFVGFQFLYLSGDIMGVANVDLRYNPVKNLYFSLRGGLIESRKQVGFVFEKLRPTTWGAGVQAAYNTIFGPIKIDLMWSDMTQWGYQISAGFDF